MQPASQEFRPIYQQTTESHVRIHKALHRALIYIGFEHFTLLIVEKESHTIAEVRQYQLLNLKNDKKHLSLQKLILGADWYDELSGNVIFIHLTDWFTIVPKMIHDLAPELNWLGLNEATEIRRQTEEISSVVIEWFDKSGTIKAINAVLPGAHHQHICSLLLSKSLNKRNSRNLNAIISEHNLFVCVAEQQKLLLLNSYTFENDDELSFWLLGLYKQFDLKVESDTLFIWAGLDFDSPLHKHLLRFFRFIDLKNQPIAESVFDSFEPWSKLI